VAPDESRPAPRWSLAVARGWHALAHFFRWQRTRRVIIGVCAVVFVVRLAISLLVGYAVDTATQGILGMRCNIGHSVLNFAGGEVVLGDVALVDSQGVKVCEIGRASLELTWTKLPSLILERLALEDVTVNLKRDAHGKIPALANLLQGKPSKKEVHAATTDAKPSDTQLPIVLLKHLRILNIALHWEDETVSPKFVGDFTLDARGDEIATFPRPESPLFQLKLSVPGVLDQFRLDFRGTRQEGEASGFDLDVTAQARPAALAGYLGKDVEVVTHTLALGLNARGTARPTLSDGGRAYTGSVTIDKLAIRADEDEVNLGQIEVAFDKVSRDEIALSSFRIAHPRFSFGRLRDGTLRVLGFGLRGEKVEKEEPVQKTESAMPRISITDLRLDDVQAFFHDDATRTPAVIETDLDLDVQNIVLEKDPGVHPIKINAVLGLPNIIDEIDIVGTAVPLGKQLDAALSLKASGIGYQALAPYLKPLGLEPDALRGRAEAMVEAHAVERPDGGLDFGAAITKATYSDERGEFGGIDSIRVDGGEVAPQGVAVDRIGIEKPRLSAHRDKGGAVAFFGLKTCPPESGPEVAAPLKKPAKPAPEKPPTRTKIGSLVVTGGKVAWHDEATAKPVDLSVDEGTLELANVVLGPEPAPAALHASAKLTPGVGDLSLEAKIVPDPAAPTVSGLLVVKHASWKPLAAYLEPEGIEPLMERGRIEAAISARARVKGGAVSDTSVKLGPLAIKHGTDELAAIDAITLEGTSVDPKSHDTNLGDLTVSGIRARATREADGSIVALGMRIKPKAETAQTKSSSPTASAPKRHRGEGSLNLGTVAIKDCSFLFHDAQVKPEAYLVVSQLDASMGPRRLDEEPLPGDTPVPVKLHCVVDNVATIDADAGLLLVSQAPEAQLDLHVRSLTLAALAPYLAPSGLVPALEDGSLDAHLDVKAKLEAALSGARIEVTGVTMKDRGEELLGLDRALVSAEVDAVMHSTHVGEVLVEHPRVAASRSKTGELRYVGLIARKAEGAPAKPPEKAPEKAAKSSSLSVDKVNVTGLALDWKDEQAGAHIALDKGAIEVGLLRPGVPIATPWKVEGDLGSLGKLLLEGTAEVASRTHVAGELKIKDLKGSDLAPYLGEGSSLSLDQGSLALKLDYADEPVKGGRTTSVALNDLALAEKGHVLFGWDTLHVTAPLLDGADQVFVIDEMVLDGVRGEIVTLPGGASRSFGIEKHPVPKTPKPPRETKLQEGEPAPLPSVTIKKLSLGLAQLLLRDKAVGAEPEPIALEGWKLEATAPFVLQSEDPAGAVLDLALTGAVPGILEDAKVTLHAVPFDSEPTFRLDAALSGIQGAEIMRRQPHLDARYDLSRLKGAQAKMGATFTIKSRGRIDTIGSSPVPLAFELGVDGIDVRSSPKGPLLVGLDELNVVVPSYDMKTGAMHISKVEINNPTAVLEKQADGFRACDVLFKSQPKTDAPTEPTPQEPPKQQGGGIKIDKLTLVDGEITYIDTKSTTATGFKMSTWEIEILGIDSAWKTARRPMRISVRSRGGSYDDFKIKGTLTLAPRIEGDLEARILGLNLPTFSPATENACDLELRDGRLDIETRMSFKKGLCVFAPRINLLQPEVDDLLEDQTRRPGAKPIKDSLPLGLTTNGALHLIADSDGNVAINDLKLDLEFDENLGVHYAGSSGLVGFAMGELGKVIANAALPNFKALGGAPPPVKKTDQGSRVRRPVLFGPVESRLPANVKDYLDTQAEFLKSNELNFISLRGEVGKEDEEKARDLASPSTADRRDLIARLEAERSNVDRFRQDAVAEVRGALQVSSPELGIARAKLISSQARLKKIDASLETLYEQEREGAERGREKRAREIENDLCSKRVEAVVSYLVQRGAPVDRIKLRPPRLKSLEGEDDGRVAIEGWTARRQAIQRSEVEQKK
jgi:hypothetical protein